MRSSTRQALTAGAESGGGGRLRWTGPVCC